MIFTKRQERLIEILKKSNSWIKGLELSEMLDVSIRTIRNDILVINTSQNKPLIIASKMLGYKINSTYNEPPSQKIYNDMNTNQRLLYILTTLCINYPNKINIYDLSCELFVSESSIISDYTTLKSLFNNLNIANFSIFKKSDNIYLRGDVSELGKNYSFIVKNKINTLDNSFNYSFFKNCNLNKLINVLPNFLSNINFFSKYITFVDLVLYCAILLERCYNKISVDLNINYNKNSKEYFFVKQLVEFLEESFKISIDKHNFDFMIALFDSVFTLESKENSIQDSNIKPDNLELILKDIFQEIFEIYLIDFYQFDDIMNDLLVHIRLALGRITNKYKINNPLKEEIKNKYPFLFDIALTIGKKLGERLNIYYTSDELCYIVAYLGLALKRLDLPNNKPKLEVLVVVLEGKSILTHILNSLNETYKNVDFTGISSIEQLFEHQLKQDKKLIVSTTSLKQFGINQHLIITQSFNMIDRFNLKNVINPALHKIKELNFELIFSHYFNPSLFKSNIDITSKDELLKQICKDLNTQGYVKEDFLNSVLEREDLLPTGINTGIAFPHTTTGKAIKSCIYIITTKKSINWSGTKVKLVFLFAINSSDFKKLSNIYDFIINISSPSTISLICKCNSFDEFKKIMYNEYIKI